jgi:pimeloyl-ACP methyl ester carboxylesterase
MSEFVLVPGAGGEAWYWSQVVPLLHERGHRATAIQLPAGDDDAGLYAYADIIIEAISSRNEVVLVAQSMGAFSAPMAAAEVDVDALLLVAPMIPTTGESVDAWWESTAEGRRHAAPFDPVTSFFHDVPQATIDEAFARGEPEQSGRPCAEPWPLDAWPDVRTRVLVARHDRLFPYDFARELARERLGVEADTIDTGHLPALARPRELAAWMDAVS